MATLALLNGKKYDIKEDANQITKEINASDEWIRLTLIRDKMSSDPKEENTCFMKAAIAYWY